MSLAVTFTAPIITGNLLVLGVVRLATATLSGVTDSLGNTWTQGATANINNTKLEMWYVGGSLSGSNTVTVAGTLSTADAIGFAASYTQITQAPPPYDQIATNTVTATSITVGPVTTTQNSELAVMLVGLVDAANFLSNVSVGWSVRFIKNNGSSGTRMMFLDRSLNAIGSYSGTVGFLQSGDGSGIIMTFKKVATGSLAFGEPIIYTKPANVRASFY